MNLGVFSISLNVKDIYESKKFYEKLGFVEIGGNISKNWVIMRNKSITIGLFKGMFSKNILTFNPGWNNENKPLKEYDDVRKIQKELIENNIPIAQHVDPDTKGPGSIIIFDPDGNQILIDQHL